ncbi:unnamed protein product [Darwinula stevensoni]|uniref:Uncharacterized protein n=1 Tax=Darwinula stevensoni TaxID=69355 RepID=A0A7R9AC30_9CRUS|nr:unnamed protein product [Darwinula stevensoni]CAG0899812.1 unnamed protein product [Darwinula stevensoni]
MKIDEHSPRASIQVNRPLSMKKEEIRPRKRKTKSHNPGTPMQGGSLQGGSIQGGSIPSTPSMSNSTPSPRYSNYSAPSSIGTDRDNSHDQYNPEQRPHDRFPSTEAGTFKTVSYQLPPLEPMVGGVEMGRPQEVLEGEGPTDSPADAQGSNPLPNGRGARDISGLADGVVPERRTPGCRRPTRLSVAFVAGEEALQLRLTTFLGMHLVYLEGIQCSRLEVLSWQREMQRLSLHEQVRQKGLEPALLWVCPSGAFSNMRDFSITFSRSHGYGLLGRELRHPAPPSRSSVLSHGDLRGDFGCQNHATAQDRSRRGLDMTTASPACTTSCTLREGAAWRCTVATALGVVDITTSSPFRITIRLWTPEATWGYLGMAFVPGFFFSSTSKVASRAPLFREAAGSNGVEASSSLYGIESREDAVKLEDESEDAVLEPEDADFELE